MKKVYIVALTGVIVLILGYSLYKVFLFNGKTAPAPASDEQTTDNTIQAGEVKERAVSLFYYNPSKDSDASLNVNCTKKGLVAVERKIPITKTPIQDTIRLLLQGQLIAAERAAGLTTEYPLSGLALTGASLKDGILTLSFVDPNSKTGGGSCRVSVLWMQIEETAKQFLEVKQVRFLPEELFQP